MTGTRNFKVGTRVFKLGCFGTVVEVDYDEWLGEVVTLIAVVWAGGRRSHLVPSDDYLFAEEAPKHYRSEA